MEFQTFDVSICNANKKDPIETSTFLHGFCVQGYFMFSLLLLTVDVQNTICNSLLTIVTTSWQNLNTLDDSNYKNLNLFDIKPVYNVSYF